ncbi:hypothetical protein QBC39DRAFT_371881 [Podospora conica]|nr:hypothetical protein QBC39DRAFT_371881 [Schizothecium conicum]
MPIRPAISRTAGPLPSFVPVISAQGSSSSFVFWEAIQLSNAIYGFSGLAFERYLAEGGQFKVELYRNPEKDSDMPELVAVKTAKIDTTFVPEDQGQEAPRLNSEDDIRRRKNDLFSFVQEIQVLSHPPLQSHPNIMRLLGSSWTTDAFGTPIPQLIVEYSSLGNLFDMLAASPPLDTQAKLDIISDIASGLERVHDCGIVHGDMKLSNIMVFPSERPACRFTAKISDFGSSIAADDPDDRKVYWGSPGYCPPDAMTEKTMSMADLRSCDVFGLGLCTWEILNDGRPFFEPDEEQIPTGRQTASDNRIPRDAQRQSVKDLQELWPSLKGPERCQALVMLSDCFAHGYGTSVNFQECLRHLQLAADDRDTGAVDAVLIPISAAILGETEHSLLQSSDIKRTLRPELMSLEKELCQFPHHERYYRRWLQWVDITHRMIVSPLTVEDFDGTAYVLDPNDEVKRDICILDKIKDPIQAIARPNDRDSIPCAMPLLQLAAAMNWGGILRKIHARDANMLHYIYGHEMFPPTVANFGSILLAAVAHGRSELVKFLVQDVGVNVMIQPDCAGLPAYIGPLHLAFNTPEDVLQGTVELLIDHGADVNFSTPGSTTVSTLPGYFPLEISGPPLDVAISIGRLSLVKILLDKGANPLLKCEGTMFKRPHNPLQLAVALHAHEIVDAILGHLAKTMGENDGLLQREIGNPMLHVAGQMLGGKGLFWKWLLHGSQYRDACQRTIEVCLKYGLEINGIDEDGDTPLISAAVQNPCHGYVLETLLDHGADPNIQNKYGSFALSLCLNSAWDSADYSRCVKALISSRADIHLAVSNGRQPIHLHAAAGMKESVNLLLDAGADIESRDKDDDTPLAVAVLSDAYACAEILLDRGANVNALIQSPSTAIAATALSYAASSGNLRMFRLLTKRGALPFPPISRTGDNPPAMSALYHAAQAGRAEIVRVALREFPAIYRTPQLLTHLNGTGYTVLHIAARMHLGCVRELLLAGASLETRDPNRDLDGGDTPLGASVQGGAFRISRFLLQYGACPWVRGPPEQRRWSFLCEGLILARTQPGAHGTVAALLEETWEWVTEWDLLRVRDFGGRTILHMAVYYGLAEVVKVLVERGASVYDRLGEPMEDVSWETTDLSGLNSWVFARTLRRLSPEERESLYDPNSVAMPDEDMDEVLRYLQGFQWPVTETGEETDSDDDWESDDTSDYDSELEWEDTTDEDRGNEQFDLSDGSATFLSYYQHAHHWFQSSSQRPTCIVEVGTPEDVAAALRIIGETRTPFAVMSGGHASNRGFSSTEGVHISLRRMDEVVVKDGGVVEVGFGARWTDVFMKLEGTGWNVVGGRVGGPGVGGFTLGGGYSWKTNQYGLTIDTVKSFNIVLPNGTITTASNTTNTGLFFALKGGLNRFGIVTSAEFYAHKQPPKVYGGFIMYPSFSLPAVLNETMEFYRTSTDPRTEVLTTTAASPIGGSSAIVLFFHDAAEKPKVFDLFTDIPHLVNTMRTQPFYEFVDGIPSEIVSLVNFRGAFATMSTSALTTKFLDAVKNETDRFGRLMAKHHGVQINYDIEPFVDYGKFATESAFPHKDSPLPLNLYFAWASKADDEFWYDEMRGSLDRLKDVATGEGIYDDTFTQYPNYALFDATAEELYGEVNAERLRRIRHAVDPERVMDLAGGFAI